MTPLAWAGLVLLAFIVGAMIGHRMTASRYRRYLRHGHLARVFMEPPPDGR